MDRRNQLEGLQGGRTGQEKSIKVGAGTNGDLVTVERGNFWTVNKARDQKREEYTIL